MSTNATTTALVAGRALDLGEQGGEQDWRFATPVRAVDRRAIVRIGQRRRDVVDGAPRRLLRAPRGRSRPGVVAAAIRSAALTRTRSG
jgi:hypothetical protein